MLREAREKLFLYRISQGAAIGLWILFCQTSAERSLGGFVDATCWLSFANTVRRFLGDVLSIAERSSKPSLQGVEASGFVASVMAESKACMAHEGAEHFLLCTPVFLGQGLDDTYVDIALGKQVRDILTQVGLITEWKEYTGEGQLATGSRSMKRWMTSRNFQLTSLLAWQTSIKLGGRRGVCCPVRPCA